MIARKIRMLHMGLPLGSPVPTRMKLAYGIWIGVQLICQVVVAYFKGCATPGTPSYTAWAATEMLCEPNFASNSASDVRQAGITRRSAGLPDAEFWRSNRARTDLLVYCTPAALAYVYTLWVCRWIRLHNDDENNARLYEQFIEVAPVGPKRRAQDSLRSDRWFDPVCGQLSSTLALLAMPPLFVTGIGFCMQMTIYFTPHLEFIREIIDCIACFLFLSSASMQRAAIIRSICSRNEWHAWERTLESSRLALLSGADSSRERYLSPSTVHGEDAASEDISSRRMKAIAKLSSEARRRCKAVRLSQFGGCNPFARAMGSDSSGEKNDHPQAELCEPDFFVSHSWRDSPELKWAALQKVAAAFEAEYGREPTLWIGSPLVIEQGTSLPPPACHARFEDPRFARLPADKYCIDQANITSSLRYLPVYVAMSRKVLLLLGDSYFTRLWCVWELYVIGETSGFAKLLVWTLGSKRLSDVDLETSRFAVKNAGCYLAEDHAKIIHIIDSSSGRANARAEFECRIVDLGRHISAKGRSTARYRSPPLLYGRSIDKIAVVVQRESSEEVDVAARSTHDAPLHLL